MNDFEEIDIHQAKEFIDQGNVTIVDIRDPASYEQGHIASALAVNDHNIQEFLESAQKDKPVLCYCYHGFSSMNAAQYFVQNGFQKVYSMKGGFEEWSLTYPFDTNDEEQGNN